MCCEETRPGELQSSLCRKRGCKPQARSDLINQVVMAEYFTEEQIAERPAR